MKELAKQMHAPLHRVASMWSSSLAAVTTSLQLDLVFALFGLRLPGKSSAWVDFESVLAARNFYSTVVVRESATGLACLW